TEHDMARFLFFFSSRRRHTRFSRDWSSDVCSSDLIRPPKAASCFQGFGAILRRSRQGVGLGRRTPGTSDSPASRAHACNPFGPRSEERRVGEECRSWRSTDRSRLKIYDKRSTSLGG